MLRRVSERAGKTGILQRATWLEIDSNDCRVPGLMWVECRSDALGRAQVKAAVTLRKISGLADCPLSEASQRV